MMGHLYYIPTETERFLKLDRPIVFFDLETTGRDTAKDRIVEICAIKMHQDGTEEERKFLVNPTIPIPAGASAVHGYTDEMVADQPTFAQLADELARFFTGCDLGGYNLKSYDIPLLMKEFERVGKYPINFNEIKIVDVMRIYHHKEKRDLAAAVKFYCEKEHEGAHSAQADVRATIDILKHQLLRYNDLQPNISFLHDYLSANDYVDGSKKFKRDENGEILINFGKHYAEKACTQPEYLKWMFEQGDFMPDTKMVAKKIYMSCIWEKDMKAWLQQHKILDNQALAATLYTVVKFEKTVFPFDIKREEGKWLLTYLLEPPVLYTFHHKDAVLIFLQLLERFLSKEEGST